MNAPEAVPVSGRPGGARDVRLRVLLVAVLGVALVVYLLGHIGFRAVLSAATSVGWGGFLLICAFSFVVFAILGPAWYVLLPQAAQPRIAMFITARMVRDSASEALPFSQVGGMILGVRAASVLGTPPRLAVASMIVDVTTELLGQLAYIVVGVVIFSARAAGVPLAHSLERNFLIGVSLVALGGLLFLALQRRGLGWLSGKLASRMFPASAAYAQTLASELRDIYRRPLRVSLSMTLHFCGWIGGAVGTWIAFRLIHVRIDVASVIAIDSMVYALRSIAFFVPNALGVQEAAYALFAPLVGIGKEFALAISLIKRARDIAIGIPILLAWQVVESRRALARGAQSGEHRDRVVDPPEG